MFRKKIEAMPAAILILTSILLPACSKTPETDVAKTDIANQSSTNLNNNVSAGNIVTAISPSAPTPIGNNNAATPTADRDKKSSPSAAQPKPQIGSGGDDLFLFTQVRSALGADKELINSVIVEIKEGNAILTGKVASEALKTKAGQLVQSVTGIKSVKNNLRVSS